MSESEITTLDTSPAATPTSQANEVPEVQKQTIFAPLESPLPQTALQQAKKKKKGFFNRIWEWATTPDEVTWKKTRAKNNKRSSRK